MAPGDVAGTRRDCHYLDQQALAELNRFFQFPLQDSSHLLHMDPVEIAPTDRCFCSNKFDLMTCKKWPCANCGNWKNHNRGLGWGIASIDSSTFIGLKRTFVFHRIESIGKNVKTNWFMDVYSSIDDENNIKIDMYLCQVRQGSHDLRRRCTCHTPKVKDQERLELTMEGLERFLFEGNETSTGGGNQNSRRLRDFFTHIEMHSPRGEGQKMSICKHCCMVYRGGPTSRPHGTNHLRNHHCKCGCNH